MNQLEVSLLELGKTARALVKLHLEEPENFTAEYILGRLLSEYQNIKEDEVNA